MGEILEFFKQIADTYGMTTAIVCLSLASLLYGAHYLIKAFPGLIQASIERRIAQTSKEHIKANLKRKNIAVEVSRSLSDLIIETGVNRALLFEFSNGSSNLAGLPFLFINATSESLSYGTNSIAYAYQRINVSLFADFISEVEKKGYFYIYEPEDIKESYPAVYNILKVHNSGSLLFYAIYGMNEILGAVMISVPNGKQFTRQAVLATVAESAQRISNLLNLEDWEEKIK